MVACPVGKGIHHATVAKPPIRDVAKHANNICRTNKAGWGACKANKAECPPDKAWVVPKVECRRGKAWAGNNIHITAPTKRYRASINRNTVLSVVRSFYSKSRPNKKIANKAY